MTNLLREILERRKVVATDEFVFSTKQGRHYETSWVKRAVKRAELSETDGSVSLHTLRHTMAVHMLQAGLNLLEVQQLLGHKNIRSTMIYVHLVPDETAKKIVRLIDGLDANTAPKPAAKRKPAAKLVVVR